MESIAFEQIHDVYYWGHYGDFKVIVRKTDGYINVTKLCADKQFTHWNENKMNQILIREMNIHADDLIQSIIDVPNEVCGTYAHPDLVPHIVSWASPQFAIKVARIVNESIIRDYKEDTRIGDLNKKIDEQTKQINELLGYTKDTNKHVETILDIVDARLYPRR